MKKLLITVVISFFMGIFSGAQETNDTYLDKVRTLDDTIETLYEVISGTKEKNAIGNCSNIYLRKMPS